MESHKSILSNVIAFRKSIDELSKELIQVNWDYHDEIINMSSQDLIEILDRFLQGDISKQELEDWANLIECREDIDLNKNVESIMYSLANPELEGPISSLKVKHYIRILKKKNLSRLLEIASESIENEYIESTTSYTELNDIFNIKNGFYAFESALHFFSATKLEWVNNIIRDEKLYDLDYVYFAEDIFGNLFCMKSNDIFMLDVETGKLDFIANSLDEWAKEILKDYNYLTGYSLAHDWQVANGKLPREQRLVPKKLFIFGGTYSVDNLTAQDTLEGLRYRSNIAYQLKNVKDGEKVVLSREHLKPKK